MSARSASVVAGSGRRPYSCSTEKTTFVIASRSRFVAGRIRMGRTILKEPTEPWKPTRQQCLAADGRTIPDILAPDLSVVFCGINPGLYSAAVQHHFARPGNRFWPALYAGGFTPRVFSPFEERQLLPLGYGITNVVDIASASADTLTRE